MMNQLLVKMNADTSKQVYEENMLFATLDTSVRKVNLPDKKEFHFDGYSRVCSKLPHHLVKAFRSTLEEARDADLCYM